MGALRRRGMRCGGEAALVAAVVACAAGGVSAQDVPRRWYFDLERSRIFHSPGNNTVFEAQIAPQLVVVQTLDDLFDSDGVFGTSERRRAWSLSASPMVRLRMSADRSQPILPPSFMPHFVGQLFLVRSLADVPAGSTPRAAELARRTGDLEMWTLQARLSHHSNGQDGCLFTTQTLRPVGDGEECVFAAGTGPDPATVNFDDGSFSTNFLRLSAFYRRLRPSTVEEDVFGRAWFVGAGVEAHAGPVIDALPGAIPADQEPLYGSWRWQASGGVSWRRSGGFWAGGTYLEGRFEHAPGSGEDVPSWSAQLEAMHLLDRFGGWGLYARLFHGQDYYNLAFVREETFVHLGLAWAQDRFLFGRVTGGG